MKRFIYLIAALAVSVTAAYALPYNDDGDGQEKARELTEKEQKKAEKALKKAEQERLDSLSFVLATRAIQDKHFVIVADRVSFRSGYTVNVNSTTNFVMQQGDDVTVQLAFERGFSGPNGLGGITVTGQATRITSKFDKKGNFVYSMMVSGTAISADVSFTLPKNGTNCNVTVDSNFYPTRITFWGELKPYNNSNEIFQGRPIP